MGTPEKFQISNTKPKTDAGANGALGRYLSLVLLWSLEFGIWSFLPGFCGLKVCWEISSGTVRIDSL